MQDQPNVPYGYCQCGCGQKTTISPYNDRHKDWVRGEPKKYIRFHYAPAKRSPEACYREHLKKVEVDEPSGCWLWQGAKIHGYGQCRVAGKAQLAHRYFYEHANGTIPDGLPLDHLCRTPACVNPEHLEPVTYAENARRGNTAKLIPSQVREIRRLVAAGIAHRVVARQFGIWHGTVSQIASRRTWKDIGDADG